MKKSISFTEFCQIDFECLMIMALKLWKDEDALQRELLLRYAVTSDKHMIWIAKDVIGRGAGFCIFSIRTDFVEGSDYSPTGYLEGIYVDATFRNHGIAKQFIHLGEHWTKEKGCTQIGSDTWLTDTESRKFHQKMGFREEVELVHFLKNIK